MSELLHVHVTYLSKNAKELQDYVWDLYLPIKNNQQILCM